jgi:hypothetical protein
MAQDGVWLVDFCCLGKEHVFFLIKTEEFLATQVTVSFTAKNPLFNVTARSITCVLVFCETIMVR